MSERSWNDHPILIIGGAFLSGLGVALSVAVPIYTTAQQNTYNEKSDLQKAAFDAQLKTIEERYSRDKSQISLIEQFRQENAALRKITASTLEELYKKSADNPIDKITLSPKGLQTIRTGGSFDAVKVLFPKAEVQNDECFIDLPKGFFVKLQLEIDDNKITGVHYYVSDNKLRPEKLLGAVSAALGKPSRKIDGPHQQPIYMWDHGSSRASVYRDQYTFGPSI